MTRKSIKSVMLLAAAVASINAQTVDDISRYQAGCDFLKGAIYCFGGNRGNFTTDIATDTTMYRLDLSKNATMAELATNWTLVQPNTNGVTVESRKGPQFAKISDTQLVFSGGYGGGANNAPILDQTIVYDAETNSWSKYANYAEGSFGNRQIYYGASAFVPGKGAVFYGGFEEHINPAWTITTTQNITATQFGSGISRVIGYVAATYLNVNQTNVWNVPSAQTNAPSVFSAFQTSVYSPVDKRVYYLGGTYQDTTVPGYQPSTYANWHPLTYALYFDTTTNTWGNQSLKGSIIPTNRRYHTLTILPNNQTQMLLYGGESDTAVSNDFAFILDLTTFTWSQVSFPVTPDGADLLRTRHNAVLLNNNTLLTTFGLSSSGQATSRPLQFNITSSTNISYLSQYVAPASAVTETPTSSKDGGISSGAIAGIVVAIVVAVIIAAVVAFFCLRKKKNAKKVQERNDSEETQQKLRSANHSQEPIEVNWDEIEKQYVEIPQPEYAGSIHQYSESVNHKPHLASNDNSDETATYVVSQSSGSVSGNNAKHYVPNIAQIPDEGAPTPYLIMKPDGGH